MKYIPPVLPLAGGFLVDFVRLYQMIESWGKADPDELRAERIDTINRLLESQASKTL
jgi:hypothetical protein